MCPLTCSVTTMSAGCCHTPGEGTRLGRRNKDRDGPTIANSSFAKCLLMGLAPALEKGWRKDGGRVEGGWRSFTQGGCPGRQSQDLLLHLGQTTSGALICGCWGLAPSLHTLGAFDLLPLEQTEIWGYARGSH